MAIRFFPFKRKHTTAGEDVQGFGDTNMPESTVKERDFTIPLSKIHPITIVQGNLLSVCIQNY